MLSRCEHEVSKIAVRKWELCSFSIEREVHSPSKHVCVSLILNKMCDANCSPEADCTHEESLTCDIDEKSKQLCYTSLCAYDFDYVRFPQRAFEFVYAGDVLLDQDISDVGRLVWDAELVLAHYVDCLYGPPGGESLRGKRILELGAGTGLAGIVAARLGADVTVTEQAKLVGWLTKCVTANFPLDLIHERKVTPPTVSKLEWTSDWLVASEICDAIGGPFDLIIGADIFYIEVLWNAIIVTSTCCTAPGSTLLLSYEQRRSNVSAIFDQFDQLNDATRWKSNELTECDKPDGLLAMARSVANVKVWQVDRLPA